MSIFGEYLEASIRSVLTQNKELLNALLRDVDQEISFSNLSPSDGINCPQVADKSIHNRDY